MKKRQIMAITGRRASGKTEETKRIISEYDGKVLIVDPFDEYSRINKKPVKKIRAREIHSWDKKEIRRINETTDELLKFRNGLLVIEQIPLSNELYNTLCITNRTRDIDVIFIMQNWPYVIIEQNLSLHVLFRHNDEPSDFRESIYHIANTIINNNKIIDCFGDTKNTPYYSLTIDMENMKIIGDYTNNDYINACCNFMIKEINATNLMQFLNPRSWLNKRMKQLFKYSQYAKQGVR